MLCVHVRMDGKVCDFRLVSTYIPFIVTIMRAQIFTTFAYVIRRDVSEHIYCALLLNVTYFDALMHVELGTSKIAGHLLPMCFAWLARQWSASASASSIPYAYEFHVLVGLMWLLWVQMLLVAYTFRRRLYFSAAAVTVVNSAFVLVHVCFNVYEESILETNARCFVFYVACFIHFHAFQTRSQWDVKTHICVGPHVAMHVLYVDGYFVLISAVMLAFMCVHVYLQNQKHAHCSDASEAKPKVVDCEFGSENMSELVAQLRAAKASTLQLEA